MTKAIVYSTENCPQCHFTKRHLKNMNADFEVIDVNKDADAMKLIKDRGYMGVPVVNIGEEWFSGFKPDKLDELL